jgi:hypothetical protein
LPDSEFCRTDYLADLRGTQKPSGFSEFLKTYVKPVSLSSIFARETYSVWHQEVSQVATLPSMERIIHDFIEYVARVFVRFFTGVSS